MKLHEYQAKQWFREYGIAVPQGDVAASGEAAAALAERFGGRCVVKAQVHAGGRGQGGGVKRVESADQAQAFAASLIGHRLVTSQTGPDGLPVRHVLVEAAADIVREIYLGMLVDRAAERVVIMASSAGGMDIEQVAAETPERILKVHVHPVVGLQSYQIRKIGFGLALSKDQVTQLGVILSGLYRLFVSLDCSLAEINPLIVTADGQLLALDGKLNVDDNAVYRQPSAQRMRDTSQEDARELKAAEFELNYVPLDGNIACMVNGAGLAMATMDIIKLHGGEPANFLDVGGGATAERVSEAFKLILADGKAKSILINIFGGIVRCDLIAEGILRAMATVAVTAPIVVRLAGTNAEQGRQRLADAGMDILTATDLTDAAQQAVAAAAQA